MNEAREKKNEMLLQKVNFSLAASYKRRTHFDLTKQKEQRDTINSINKQTRNIKINNTWINKQHENIKHTNQTTTTLISDNNNNKNNHLNVNRKNKYASHAQQTIKISPSSRTLHLQILFLSKWFKTKQTIINQLKSSIGFFGFGLALSLQIDRPVPL